MSACCLAPSFSTTRSDIRLPALCGSQARSDRKLILVFGIAGNLALLGYYKYANFFVSNLKSVARGKLRSDADHSASGYLILYRLPRSPFLSTRIRAKRENTILFTTVSL